ncbi:MAG: carboxymuconolactone decarboxylase family protein, partial [Thermoplasmata archaeon]|nr:carboxymuconolactone decarboxylase family protein [Thermoplasmata archaeon]
MSSTPAEKQEIVEKIMKSIEEQYGFVPLVNQVLSSSPDLFIPSANLGKAVFESDEKKLDKKTSYL